MPELPDQSRAALSLRYQLPLLISALLVLTLVATTWAAYAEVKRVALGAAAARLHTATRQLADLSQASIVQRTALLRRVAADSDVQALLRSPTGRFSPAALAAAQPLLVNASDSVLALALWDGRGARLLAATGGLGPRQTAVARQVIAGGFADSVRTSGFYRAGDSVFYWRVVRVWERGTVVGHLGQRLRLTAAPQAERQIRALVGEDVSLFFTDTAGAFWTTLTGAAVPAPRTRATPDGLFEYEGADGGTQTAARAQVGGTPWRIVLAMPRAAVLERPRAFLRRMALAAAVIVLLGAIGAWALSRQVTAPLGTLSAAAAAVAGGDYARRVTVGRRDEIGRLGETFNAMSQRVAESQAALREQAESLQRSNEELARQKAAADAARRDAERANQTKSDFLAVMSHEIRTPINAILGYTQLMEIGISGPVTHEQRGQLERVRTSGHHLLGLVNELLDLARVESGQLTVLRERGLAADAADAALTLLRPQAAAKGIAVGERCGGPRDAAYVGDEQRVRQVVVNLLSNAVKFTHPGGSVTVRCAVAADPPPEAGAPGPGRWTTIQVEDTGIGIAPEQVARVFEPFVQAESGLTRTTGGVGLGLAISRRLARLMGGDISVRTSPGAGSCFTLWLPAAPDGTHRPAPRATAAAAAATAGPALADVGRTLFPEIPAVVERFVARLRADAGIPNAGGLSELQLQDHAPTFLADIAQSFIILRSSQSAAVSELLRDSGDIQQTISERHGAQRRRLGWTEDAMAREFAILREEVGAALERRGAPASEPALEARALLGRFIDQAERASLRGYRSAALNGDGM